MSISAVILAHYKERDKDNIARMVTDLRAGSVKPDKIIIFDDNDVNPDVKDCIIIKSNTQFPVTVRLHVASFVDTEYLLLLDTDLTVEYKTLEYLLSASNAFPESIIGFDGSILKRSVYPYSRGMVVNNLTEPFKCDMIIRLWFLPKKLINYGMMIYDAGGVADHFTDDILLCLGNRYLNGQKNVVIPMLKHRGWKELRYRNQAQCLSPDHYLTRDNACRFIMEKYGANETESIY